MRTGIFVIAALVLMIAVAACKKGDDSATIQQFTTVNFINATGDTLNVYVNGSRVNTTNSLYPMGSSGYINALLGQQNYQVRKYRNANVLFNLPVPLDTGKTYSFYLAGNTADQAFTDVDTIKNTPDTTLVRFVHTASNAGAVDVVMNDTLRFSGSVFKKTTPFLAVSPGIKRVQIFKAGTKNALTTDTLTFLDNRAYTLFVKSGLGANGLATGNLGLIVNK
ncbi:DUF4397 domain-containing protein [Mucilaginibacter sp.]|uniref:DUF4397 domain-containing protein n=1 Tax=Mucilaginibacter sp. TaxID=1882438 RepID=UPI000CC19513|nr:DUF4397 domain-containing protein [Mucilaginibacter sp.]PLW91190.1 MAG: hypothetical protein C0154_02545 [Mucilaginibacter sp.]